MLLLRKMAHAVEQIVATICTCRIRNRCGYTPIAAGLHHGIDRRGGKIGVGTSRNHRLIERLKARVVGNARMAMVDSHVLRRHLGTTRSNARAQYSIGAFALDGFFDKSCALPKFHRHLDAYDLSARNAWRQASHRLPRGVDRISPKRFETAYKYLHKRSSRLNTPRPRYVSRELLDSIARPEARRPAFCSS